MQKQPAHGHLHVTRRWRLPKKTKNIPHVGQLHDYRLVFALALRSLDLHRRQPLQVEHANRRRDIAQGSCEDICGHATACDKTAKSLSIRAPTILLRHADQLLITVEHDEKITFDQKERRRRTDQTLPRWVQQDCRDGSASCYHAKVTWRVETETINCNCGK